MKKIKIFGFVRYSILRENTNKKSWNISKHLSFKDLEKTLFNSDRLNLRASLFSKITLPSLKANQRDWADFRIIVITSERLPDWHMEYLNHICKYYPFVEIIKVNTDENAFGQAVNDYIQKEVNETETYFTYRIDDDDALSKDFVDIIKPYLTESFCGIAVSLPLGYSGFYDTYKKRISLYGETYSIMNAQALGFVSNKKSRHRHIFDLRAGSHRKIDRVVPVLLLSSKQAYFRTLHEYASMYYGKNVLESLKRTKSKIERHVSVDEIIKRINIDRNLFEEKSLPTQDYQKSVFMKAKGVIGGMIRYIKK